MILFLDFDGVLHPEYPPGMAADQPDGGPRYFTCLPAFESVLREFPHLQVVISSTWRVQHPLAELRTIFAPDLRPRIIGATPVIPGSRGPRQREIEAWMAANRAGEPWIAVDDRADFFDAGCANVFLTETLVGLDAAAAEGLRQWIRARAPA